jgi:hypothetical protein
VRYSVFNHTDLVDVARRHAPDVLLPVLAEISAAQFRGQKDSRWPYEWDIAGVARENIASSNAYRGRGPVSPASRSLGRQPLYLPHLLTVITPVEVPDEYDNPAPRLDYGPAAPRRQVRGLLQPRTSTEQAEPGRHPVTATWWVLTFDPIRVRERVEYDGRFYAVTGEPEQWSPRPGRTHYEITLDHVDG